MWRVLLFVVVVTLAAMAGAGLADLPGEVSVSWLGYHFEDINIYAAMVAIVFAAAVLMLLWSLLRYVIGRPRAIRRYMAKRNEERGREAITRGMIAAELGDQDVVGRSAQTARKALPADPLTALLAVKAARLSGDRETARALLEDMTQSSETKLAGLHGLYLEAKRENELEAARQFAERALEENPRLAWSAQALLDMQAKQNDWQGALETLQTLERAGNIPRDEARRKRAVLLTAQAFAIEEGDLDQARELALEAHGLAPELVPAASLAARLLAAQDSERRARRVLTTTWALSPHPDLATAFAYLRMGDGPVERLSRVRELAASADDEGEGAIAIGRAAIEARDWQAARDALEPLLEAKPTARAFSLLARVEEGASGNTGRVRELLARALRAPRDPAWMSDGIVYKDWAAVSPLTGELDSFVWMAPVEALEGAETPIIEAGETASDVARAQETGDQQESQPPDDAVVQGDDRDAVREAESAEDETAAMLREVEEVAASLTLDHRPDDPGERGAYVDDEAKREQPVSSPEPERSD